MWRPRAIAGETIDSLGNNADARRVATLRRRQLTDRSERTVDTGCSDAPRLKPLELAPLLELYGDFSPTRVRSPV